MTTVTVIRHNDILRTLMQAKGEAPIVFTEKAATEKPDLLAELILVARVSRAARSQYHEN